ncbi:MAG: DUF1640 domain-containing protein [Sulfuricella sp.]|nr:DUF1640 domain-containing protein [Sulfuricella sp.]
MSTVTFDTLKFVKELENAGMPQAQAEAQAKALANVLSESLDTTLVTKADIKDVKTEITAIRADLQTELAPMKAELSVIKWMGGIIVGGIVMLLLKTFFPA